jgi:hypothetical protein
MAGFVERVVQRMRQDRGFSRNRHFLALSSPEGRRAVRLHRHLRSLEADLAQGLPVRFERHEGRIRVVVAYRDGRREAWLAPSELRILGTNPVVRAALAEAGFDLS